MAVREPPAGYAAARDAAALFHRSHRVRLLVEGRAPWQMLKGVLSGAAAAPPSDAAAPGVPGAVVGRATYHTALTPKGKTMSDLRMVALEPGPEGTLLLDVSAEGAEALRAHFARVLPPRFARTRDVSDETGMLTVVGPRAAELLAAALAPDAADAVRGALEGLEEEGAWWAPAAPGGALETPLVVRTHDVWPPAFDVVGGVEFIAGVREALEAAGARPADEDAWTTLRVEAGRPAFGVDFDADTIPVEAGIHHRAIDHTKGCYTGQEVIVRIRDRGHVNRSLRLLRLGEVEPPAAGTELAAADGSGKVVGRVTSAVWSPREEQALALAYVRRGHDAVLVEGRRVEVPAEDASTAVR